MAATTMATFGGDGQDPRMSVDQGRLDHLAYVTPQMRLLHDPNVTFEEYHYYALKTRAEEAALKVEEGGSTGMTETVTRNSPFMEANSQPRYNAGALPAQIRSEADRRAGCPAGR